MMGGCDVRYGETHFKLNSAETERKSRAVSVVYIPPACAACFCRARGCLVPRTLLGRCVGRRVGQKEEVLQTAVHRFRRVFSAIIERVCLLCAVLDIPTACIWYERLHGRLPDHAAAVHAAVSGSSRRLLSCLLFASLEEPRPALPYKPKGDVSLFAECS